MKNVRFTSRRQFIWIAGMSSVLSAFGSFGRRSLAQVDPVIVPGMTHRVPGPLNARVFRLPSNSQVLLKEIRLADPNDLTSLSRSNKVRPEELEAAFEKLNDAFTFEQRTGKLTRNALVQLNSEEEETVQKLLSGYQRHVQSGEIKLRRGSNRLFVPLPNEPEIARQGVVPAAAIDKMKSIEKLSNHSSPDFSLTSPALDLDPSTIAPDSYLLAQGCGWQWWRKTYWWGIRFSLNRTAVNWLTSGAASVAAILGAMGISGIVAAAVAGLAGILKAVSNDNGVRIYITWVGIPWVTSKPTSSGGC